MAMAGVTLMAAPLVQSYYPIQDLKIDLIRAGRRVGRHTARKIIHITS